MPDCRSNRQKLLLGKGYSSLSTTTQESTLGVFKRTGFFIPYRRSSFHYFWDRETHYIAVPGSKETRLASNSLCFLSAGIKGVCCYAQHLFLLKDYFIEAGLWLAWLKILFSFMFVHCLVYMEPPGSDHAPSGGAGASLELELRQMAISHRVRAKPADLWKAVHQWAISPVLVEDVVWTVCVFACECPAVSSVHVDASTSALVRGVRFKHESS
jgi:hypothetical protein